MLTPIYNLMRLFKAYSYDAQVGPAVVRCTALSELSWGALRDC